MLTLTHDPVEGTLIRGTHHGDGSAAVLTSKGWRWGRTIGCWYIPQSRDHLPKTHIIDSTTTALQAAGFTVETQVSHQTSTTTEQIAAIVVPADTTVAPYAAAVSGLADFQRLVGGWIQPVDGPGWTAYLDEEGKVKHRPVNDRAHHFIHRVSPARLTAWDTIVGDVVFVGPINDKGDNTNAPQVLADHFGVTVPAA